MSLQNRTFDEFKYITDSPPNITITGFYMYNMTHSNIKSYINHTTHTIHLISQEKNIKIDLSHIAYYPNLEFILIMGFTFVDSTLKNLLICTKLRQLILHLSVSQDHIIFDISTYTNLRMFGPPDNITLIKAHPRLQYFYGTHCFSDNVTINQFVNLRNLTVTNKSPPLNLKKLKKLSLHVHDNIGTSTIPNVIKCPNLITISILAFSILNYKVSPLDVCTFFENNFYILHIFPSPES